ncbi:MAG TPA: hypothetical protein VH500_08115 [Nitrososphaeraceae archaeon]|jgi:hypothetical protein
MNQNLLFQRDEEPFGKSWEEWAVSWCRWIFSFSKEQNPAIDKTGKYCGDEQHNREVWFLAGTFGNLVTIKRKCIIPKKRAIFFPVLEKEDSFAEDTDLHAESDLIDRCKAAIDNVIHMEATIDGKKIEHLENYRVRSPVFDLIFPDQNVYYVKPGLTRSVCDGYWLFIKPLKTGTHYIHFKGRNYLAEPVTMSHMKNNPNYEITENSIFEINVIYELTITN